MNTLHVLRAHHAEAELDVAAWIDNQPVLRPIAAFLAHHRAARALTAVATAISAARLVDHAHAQAGEGSKPCGPCVTAEADEFAGDGQITFEDAVNAWDLKDGGLL